MPPKHKRNRKKKITPNINVNLGVTGTDITKLWESYEVVAVSHLDKWQRMKVLQHYNRDTVLHSLDVIELNSSPICKNPNCGREFSISNGYTCAACPLCGTMAVVEKPVIFKKVGAENVSRLGQARNFEANESAFALWVNPADKVPTDEFYKCIIKNDEGYPDGKITVEFLDGGDVQQLQRDWVMPSNPREWTILKIPTIKIKSSSGIIASNVQDVPAHAAYQADVPVISDDQKDVKMENVEDDIGDAGSTKEDPSIIDRDIDIVGGSVCLTAVEPVSTSTASDGDGDVGVIKDSTGVEEVIVEEEEEEKEKETIAVKDISIDSTTTTTPSDLQKTEGEDDAESKSTSNIDVEPSIVTNVLPEPVQAHIQIQSEAVETAHSGEDGDKDTHHEHEHAVEADTSTEMNVDTAIAPEDGKSEEVPPVKPEAEAPAEPESTGTVSMVIATTPTPTSREESDNGGDGGGVQMEIDAVEVAEEVKEIVGESEAVELELESMVKPLEVDDSDVIEKVESEAKVEEKEKENESETVAVPSSSVHTQQHEHQSNTLTAEREMTESISIKTLLETKMKEKEKEKEEQKPLSISISIPKIKIKAPSLPPPPPPPRKPKPRVPGPGYRTNLPPIPPVSPRATEEERVLAYDHWLDELPFVNALFKAEDMEVEAWQRVKLLEVNQRKKTAVVMEEYMGAKCVQCDNTYSVRAHSRQGSCPSCGHINETDDPNHTVPLHLVLDPDLEVTYSAGDNVLALYSDDTGPMTIFDPAIVQRDLGPEGVAVLFPPDPVAGQDTGSEQVAERSWVMVPPPPVVVEENVSIEKEKEKEKETKVKSIKFKMPVAAPDAIPSDPIATDKDEDKKDGGGEGEGGEDVEAPLEPEVDDEYAPSSSESDDEDEDINIDVDDEEEEDWKPEKEIKIPAPRKRGRAASESDDDFHMSLSDSEHRIISHLDGESKGKAKGRGRGRGRGGKNAAAGKKAKTATFAENVKVENGEGGEGDGDDKKDKEKEKDVKEDKKHEVITQDGLTFSMVPTYRPRSHDAMKPAGSMGGDIMQRIVADGREPWSVERELRDLGAFDLESWGGVHELITSLNSELASYSATVSASASASTSAISQTHTKAVSDTGTGTKRPFDYWFRNQERNTVSDRHKYAHVRIPDPSNQPMLEYHSLVDFKGTEQCSVSWHRQSDDTDVGVGVGEGEGIVNQNSDDVDMIEGGDRSKPSEDIVMGDGDGDDDEDEETDWDLSSTVKPTTANNSIEIKINRRSPTVPSKVRFVTADADNDGISIGNRILWIRSITLKKWNNSSPKPIKAQLRLNPIVTIDFDVPAACSGFGAGSDLGLFKASPGSVPVPRDFDGIRPLLHSLVDGIESEGEGGNWNSGINYDDGDGEDKWLLVPVSHILAIHCLAASGVDPYRASKAAQHYLKSMGQRQNQTQNAHAHAAYTSIGWSGDMDLDVNVNMRSGQNPNQNLNDVQFILNRSLELCYCIHMTIVLDVARDVVSQLDDSIFAHPEDLSVSFFGAQNENDIELTFDVKGCCVPPVTKIESISIS